MHKNFKNYSDRELINTRLEIDAELNSRGISLEIGALGEKLAIDFFKKNKSLSNIEPAPKGAKNIDALSRDGNRYSIKSALKAKKTGTIYPDELDESKPLFEYMLIVLIDKDLTLKAIYRFSWDTFVKIRSIDKRMKSWYVSLSSKKLATGELLFLSKSNLD